MYISGVGVDDVDDDSADDSNGEDDREEQDLVQGSKSHDVFARVAAASGMT